MAGGPGQPEQPNEHVSEVSKYLSFLHDTQNIFQGYSRSSGNKYIPRSVLTQYFALSGVSLDRLLRENLEKDEHVPQTETILQQYLAVFSVLLSIGKGKYLNRCIERRYNDERLPLLDKPRHFPTSDNGPFFDAFFDAQWKFCPATLTKNLINFQIEPEQILPLKRREKIMSSASSVIYLVEVDEEYDFLIENRSSLDNGSGIVKPASHTYLFKEFDKTCKPAFDKEQAALLFLQENDQSFGKLLTRFCGSFIDDTTYTIVLEHADRGNLETFMKNVPPPTNGEDIIRVWESILKLHESLHTIHKIDAPQSVEVKQYTLLRGWHQSLCPQNISVLSSDTNSNYDCHFRIANIGTLDEVESAKSYAAPECWIPHSDDNMQMADVFSLGCILSEFAVWMSLGLSGLNDYRSHRKEEAEGREIHESNVFHDGHKLLQAVAIWNNIAIENRADEDNITEAVMRQVVEEMLCEDADARPTTRQLKAKIVKVLSRAREQYSANLCRQGSVASNSTGMSSAARSSKSRLSYWNSVRSDSSGDTHPGNESNKHKYNDASATARSSRGHWMSASAGGEHEETFYSSEPVSLSQTMSPISPIGSRGYQQLEMGNRAANVEDAPEVVPCQRDSRVSTLSGISVAALLNGDDKEIVVTRSPLPTTSRNLRSFVPETNQDVQAAGIATPLRAPQLPNQTVRHSLDRSGMSTGAPEDVPTPSSMIVQPDHDPRAPNALSIPTSSHSHLSRSQTTASDVSVQTQLNVQSVDYPSASLPLRGQNESEKIQEITKPQVYKPCLNLIDGLLWLNNKKGSASSATLRDESYLSQVGDRDFIFLIDDSVSMRAHREMTSRCVRLMAWLLKKYDKNGMDLYFMGKPGKTHTRSGHSSDLQRPILKALDECKGVHGVDTRLAQILAEYKGRSATGSGLSTGGRSSFTGTSSTRTLSGIRKVMIYVISDGNWDNGSEERLMKTMDAVATVLSIQGAPDKAVGIQFVRSTDENKSRFDKLRAGKRDMESKIVVDTVDLESNVYRSLLGSVVDLWDEVEGD